MAIEADAVDVEDGYLRGGGVRRYSLDEIWLCGKREKDESVG